MANMGDRIKKVRISANLTQADFAQTLGITQSFLSGLERSKYQATVEVIVTIAKTYRIDANWLLMGDENAYDKSPPEKADFRAQRLKKRINRILDEGNEKKITAVEAQLEALDPETNQIKNTLLKLKPLGEAGIIGLNFLNLMLLPVTLILSAVGLGAINGSNAWILLAVIPYYWIISISTAIALPTKTIGFLKRRAVSFIIFASPRFGEW